MNPPHDAGFRLNAPFEDATDLLSGGEWTPLNPTSGHLATTSRGAEGQIAPRTIQTAFSADGFFNAALGFGS
jgi:hypothetical protein